MKVPVVHSPIDKAYHDGQTWPQAPEWAMWRTIDSDGVIRWHSTRPVLNLTTGCWDEADVEGYRSEEAGMVAEYKRDSYSWWQTLQPKKTGSGIMA